MTSVERARQKGMRGIVVRLHQTLIGVWGWLSGRAWLAIPLLAIPALLPLISQGLPYSDDGVLHLIRLAALDRLIHDGAVYPRWIPQLFVGLGYPLLNFYGPATYYFAELLHLLGLGLQQAFSASLAILLILGGFGMYRLAYDVFGARRQWAALVSATAYVYAPYLLTNLFVRGAIAELAAGALLPWILWSFRRLIKSTQPIRYLLPAVLSLGGLAITHTITLMFLAPLLCGYILVLWWQGGRSKLPWRWLAAALAFSAAISAFFWLPLITERQYLSGEAYQIARAFVPEHVWTWGNFLERTLLFDYSLDTPFRLGLVEVAVALLGFVVARRRDPEWLFFIVVALLGSLGIGAWTLPLWSEGGILLAAQFPWRLLIIVSLPLALFSGGIVLRIRPPWAKAGIALAVIALIIVANWPRLDWMQYFGTGDEALNWPEIAQFEPEKLAFGASYSRDFNPRWDQSIQWPDGITLVQTADLPTGNFATTVEQAGAYDLEATVSGTNGGPLRFFTHYFPGWRAILDRKTVLDPYPSTNLGLLTVDLPPGSHTLRLTWAGTAVQKIGTALSLLALAGLAWFYWRQRSYRWLAMVPLALLLVGLLLSVWSPRVSAVQTPQNGVDLGGVKLLGYRIERGDARRLYLYPLWYVQKTPAGSIPVRWQLLDSANQVVSETMTRSYFNSLDATNWPPGTVVDDAYELVLPPGLAPGTYSLAAETQPSERSSNLGRATVGSVTIGPAEVPPPQIKPTNPLDLVFGGQVRLAGFDLQRNGRPVVGADKLPVVHPGDVLDYTLFWQALRPHPLERLYNGFVHLVDLPGESLVKEDHRAGGSSLRAPPTWDTYYLQPDRYQVRVPKSVSNGLYWPLVGLYKWVTLDHLPVQDSNGQALGDSVRLPPVKVLGTSPPAKPSNAVSAHFGDVAVLQGYDLALPEGGLLPGSQFTVTLYYRSEAPTEVGYTQFVHLYSPELGMAAQWDAPPLRGANPTWAWVPGEIVSDTATLRIADDAKPGSYDLLVGLYNPEDGARLPARDRQGNPLPDGSVVLKALRVEPGSDQ